MSESDHIANVDPVRRRSFMLKWWGAFMLTSLVVVMATLPPFLPIEWRTLLMTSFSKICHQIPERSPHIDNIALAVCHRCYGVYLGLPIAALAFLMLRSLPVASSTLQRLMFASLVLLGLDWGAPLVGLWHNTALTRSVTGALFGLSAGFYLMHVIRKGDENSLRNVTPEIDSV